jgi:hypothetical protein
MSHLAAIPVQTTPIRAILLAQIASCGKAEEVSCPRLTRTFRAAPVLLFVWSCGYGIGMIAVFDGTLWTPEALTLSTM